MTMSICAVLELGHDGRLLLRRLEARHHLDAHREVGEAVAEGAPVLLGEDRGGHEHRHLPPALHRLEGGADGDLGLAVAHVAHEEAIHGALALHVALHVVGGLALVGRVLEQERALELPLPGAVGVRAAARAAILRRA